MKTRTASPLPLVEPIALVPERRAFDDRAWTFELKYDGYRAVLYAHEGQCRFVSRNGKHMRRFDDFCTAVVGDLRERDVILDGEIFSAAHPEGWPVFADVARKKRLAYAAFDILWLTGSDLRHLSLRERRRVLKKLIKRTSSHVSTPYPFKIDSQGKALFALICKHDLEGIVAKRLDDPYDPHRARWLKIKNPAYSQIRGRAQRFNRKT